MSRPALSSLRALLHRYRAQETGVAAIEFALIAPILIALWLGTVELSQGLSVDRRLDQITASVGDLVARTAKLTEADMSDIFEIVRSAMTPYPEEEVGVVVSAVDIDEEGNASVAWSRARGPLAAHASGSDVTGEIPASLRRPNSQVIVSEGSYAFRPALGYTITGTINLSDQHFFVPRESEKVELCGPDEEDCG
ncbi:TadE/TadG family type IV pilus assembly protein [Afifella sp. IM 167]|uniref:TadE/TadG family type IV pilus assembly protein n=1 Tax=Afifella sp. IM 167 TaxID=2033586 RepID=UPI001CCCA0E6|nr:TadE/TadG family type IV pilus assembly protein [Afifella sp. IM 167]MBZ8133771.1 hypothetical protein [Afifella sp. IM 167]